MARIPYILKVISNVLPSIISEDSQKMNLEQPSTLRVHQLIERFVDQSIKSEVLRSLNASANSEIPQTDKISEEQEELNQNLKRVKQQAQRLALELNDYPTNKLSSEADIKALSLLPGLCSLVEWNSSQSQVRFRHPLVMEYFVSKQIEEELHEANIALQNKKGEVHKEMSIFNKLHLNGKAL